MKQFSVTNSFIFLFVFLWFILQLLAVGNYLYYQTLIDNLHLEVSKFVERNAQVWQDYQVLCDFVFLESPNGKSNNKVFKRRKLEVTLVTQCSTNNLRYLLDLLNSWHGPVSIAVFAPGRQFVHAYFTAQTIFRCFPSRDVNFQFVFPSIQPPSINDQDLKIWYELFFQKSNQCENIGEVLQLLIAPNYAIDKLPYPHNTLRNVAKRQAATTHMILLDVDVLPSPGIRESFLSHIAFDNSTDINSNVIYVVPAFEISHDDLMPRSKTELVQAVKSQRVRIFHTLTCPFCHKATK